MLYPGGNNNRTAAERVNIGDGGDRMIDLDATHDPGRWPSPTTGQHLTVGEQLSEAQRSVDELLADAQRFESTAEYAKLLRFVSAFRSYSPFNGLLVEVQKPGSTFVAPAARWQDRYQRALLPGAQAIAIQQPYGPVMFVYDVSDTVALPGAPELPREVSDPFSVSWSVPVEGILDRTIKNSARDGIRITRVGHGSLSAGRIRAAELLDTVSFTTGSGKRRTTHAIPLAYELEINARHDIGTQYATLCHELAHLYCGHLGSPNEKHWPDRADVTDDIAELEAESVAFVVARRLDSSVRFPPYLRKVVDSQRRTPRLRLTLILRVAHDLEMMGSRELPVRER